MIRKANADQHAVHRDSLTLTAKAVIRNQDKTQHKTVFDAQSPVGQPRTSRNNQKKLLEQTKTKEMTDEQRTKRNQRKYEVTLKKREPRTPEELSTINAANAIRHAESTAAARDRKRADREYALAHNRVDLTSTKCPPLDILVEWDRSHDPNIAQFAFWEMTGLERIADTTEIAPATHAPEG